MLNLKKSAAAFAEAKTLMPGGVNSPVRSYANVGCNPPFIARAQEDIIFHGLLRKSGFGHWTEHEHSPSEDVEVWCSEKKPTYYVKIGLLLGLGIGVVVGSIFGISRWITALVGGLIGILCCTAIDVKNSRKRYEILKQEQERT